MSNFEYISSFNTNNVYQSDLTKTNISRYPELENSLTKQLEKHNKDKSEEEIAVIEPILLNRADSLPIESFEDATDPYLEGYIQALIDVHYYEFKIIVYVADGYVYLANLPRNKLLFQKKQIMEKL